MKKILIGILVLLMIGLLYIILTKQKLKEGFVCGTTCNNYSIIGLGANALVDRNNTNVIVNPRDNSANIIVGSPGRGCWNSDTNITNAYIVVNLNNLMKITTIVTQGLKYFRVYFSQTDNISAAYEEILYQDSTAVLQGTNTIYFTANSYENPTQFDNLLTQDGQPVFAQFIKIVPINQNNSNPDTSTTPSPTDLTIGSNGVKLEIFGVSGDSKITNGGESLIGSAKFYDINGSEITSTWASEDNNLEPRLRIVFNENGVVVPKTIYSIIFSPNCDTPTQWVKEFSLTYSHNKSKVSDTIYNIKGNTNCGTNQVQFYFNHPIIATELLIKPTQSQIPISAIQITSMKIVDILGSSVTTNQEQVLLDKNKQKYCTSDNPDGCGSVSDLLGKQAEIQQLCDSLDLQDQIKENNQRIQKNRQYIMQLEEHDKKISNLENIVNQMKQLRMLKQKSTDQGILSQQVKQSDIDNKLQQLVEERKKSQSQFNVKLNVQTNSGLLNNLETSVKSAESAAGVGNDTAKTPLEGFTNYSSTSSFKNVIPSDPFENRWLEHKFKVKLEEKNSQGFIQPTMLERQFEQVMNQGYNYVNYSDNTNKNQRNPENQMKLNNRVFIPSDPGYLYEKVKQPTFYEDVALTSNNCDTNTKFIKQLK